MIADYRGHCLVKTRLFDGIVELLAGLHDEGVTLAVFSNKADDLTRRIVESLIGADVFEEVVGAQPAIPLKPDPAGALLVAGRLGIVPERIAFVGDSGIDMLTATRAGMIAVGVSWGLRERDELLANGADAIIDHPLELLELRE
jgi:phosphoglycolate phosphatase